MRNSHKIFTGFVAAMFSLALYAAESPASLS